MSSMLPKWPEPETGCSLSSMLDFLVFFGLILAPWVVGVATIAYGAFWLLCHIRIV